jgi:Methylamine utilisation protein MauE
MDFRVPSPLVPLLTLLLPLTELTVAVALIPITLAWWGAIGALALLLLFMVGITLNLAQGRTPECHCFGQFHSAPAGWSTLIRNGVLAVLAGFIVWQGKDDVGLSVTRWVTNLTTTQLISLVISMILLGFLAIEGWFILHLIHQNGRLLMRLETLEARLEAGEVRPAARSDLTLGLPIGSRAPAFRLSDLRWTQCQAQLLDQFSVWVPPLTLTKRLTLGLRARAGRSVPGRGRCAPPAPKKSVGAARQAYPR